MGIETILAALQIVDEALLRMRQSTHSRMLAEAALVRLCRLEQLDMLSALVGSLESGGSAKPQATARPRPTVPPAAAQKKTLNGSPDKRVDPAHAEIPPRPVTNGPSRGAESTAVPVAVSTTSPARALSDGNLHSIWQDALGELDGMTHLHASRSTARAISGPNRLAIQFPQTYTSSKAFCERPQQRQWLEQALEKVVGSVVRVEFTVSDDPQQPAQKHQPKVPQAQLRKQVASNALVQKAVELFDATVISVEPAAQMRPDIDEDAG